MLQQYIQLVIGLSIPQTLVRIWLVFAAAGLGPTKRHAGKLALFSVASSGIVELDYWFVSAPVHALNSTVLALAILYALFRKLGFRSVLILFVAYTLLSLLTDMIGGMLIQFLYGLIDRKSVIVDYPLALQSVYVPLGAALGLLAVYLEKRSFPFLHRLYQYLLDIQQSRMKEVLLLTIVQLLALGMLFSIGMEYGEQGFPASFYNWTIYALVLLTFCAIFYMLRLVVRIREDAITQTRDVYAEEIGQMFTVIRGHRHDFLNHLQVISSLLQMNKIEQLRSYMKDLTEEARAVAPAVAYASPVLAAFVIGKTEQARTKEIPFICDIPANADIESSIRMMDFVKIMGNLVDNAFEESEMLPHGSRDVKLEIRSEGETLVLEVSNRGRALSDKELSLMTKPGYTTKTVGHSGLGLAIVQERVRFYQGTLSIHFCPDDGTTIVRVRLPRKA
ncbi:sensor histidine kinase [Cohnella hongkongensis]|uniref:Sensor histidine kinase n=1 Tax=Cohnella hongkongensis TaxID=178337 RepID=A0ABV9F5K6_9BACL